jgi:D-sedoheptulose 7-phosphate isomerase
VHARIDEYFRHLAQVGVDAEASDAQGRTIALEDAVDRVVKLALDVKSRSSQVMFVGNGGSAGIASHMATDWLKNGGFKATAFNDPSMLTCLANDLGYDQVFAVPIQRYGREGDLLFAISSSGKSDSILNAVAAARACRAKVVTLSGFSPDNPLRKLGDFNFWAPDGHYGFVELSHLALCHAILDMTMGWQKAGDLPLAMGAPSVSSQ